MNMGGTTHDLLAGGNVGYLFGGSLQGFTLGLHALQGKVYADPADPAVLPITGDNTSTLRMTGAYAFCENDGREGIAEYYHFNNRDESGGTGTHASWAGFAQLGRLIGKWTPYARAEETSLDPNDNYFADQTSGRSYQRRALGLRYDLNEAAAIKSEFNRTRQTDGVSAAYNEWHLQYAIRF